MLIPIGDLLLAIAGVAATMVGAFLVGLFFYIDGDVHRMAMGADRADAYLRSGFRWVLLVYIIPIIVPLALVGLPPIFGAVLFLALGAALLLLTVETTVRMISARGPQLSRTLIINDVLTSATVPIALVLPWLLGGWPPDPSAYLPTLIILLGIGLSTTCSLVMSEFDVTMGIELPPGRPRRGPRSTRS